MTKVLFLSDPNNPHTIKWISGLSQHLPKIYLWGLPEITTEAYKNMSNVQISTMNISREFISGGKVTKFATIDPLVRRNSRVPAGDGTPAPASIKPFRTKG